MFRYYDRNGALLRDELALASEERSGEPLIRPVMHNGKRTAELPSLDVVRQHTKRELSRLPPQLVSLTTHTVFPVEVTKALEDLAHEVDRRIRGERESA